MEQESGIENGVEIGQAKNMQVPSVHLLADVSQLF